VDGYELHEGTTVLGDVKPLFRIIKGVGNGPGSGYDGAVADQVAGTYFHGVFHNFHFRRFFTNLLRKENGLDELGFVRDDFEDLKRFSIDRLAYIFEDNIDMSVIEALIEKV